VGFLSEKDAIVEMDRMMHEHAATIGRAHHPSRTFGDVAEDWLRHGEFKRGLKRSTLRDYQQVLDSYLLPAFGELPLMEVTPALIDRWHAGFRRSRTAEKVLMVIGAILTYAVRRGWVLENAALAVERHPVRYSGDYDFYAREEVDALIRHAASEQDAAIYATAAMTGLRRGELVALRWRDVDFAGQAVRVRGNWSHGQIVTPKSGKVRVVPMVPEVAQHLARLGQRELFTGDDDPVFRERDRRASRRLGAAPPLCLCGRARRVAATAVSLAAPPLRISGSQSRVAGAGAGVDGPLARPDDRPIPPFTAPRRATRRSWPKRSPARRSASGRSAPSLAVVP